MGNKHHSETSAEKREIDSQEILQALQQVEHTVEVLSRVVVGLRAKTSQYFRDEDDLFVSEPQVRHLYCVRDNA